MNATISKNQIAVKHNTREDGSNWLTVEVPNGWDDCKEIVNKVLQFNGLNYTWRGWNSDRNEAFFRENNQTATVK